MAEALVQDGETGARRWNPLDWRLADRCILVSAFVLLELTWASFWVRETLDRAGSTTFYQRDFIEDVYLVGLERVLMPIWILVGIMALAMRRRAAGSRVLVHATQIAYVATSLFPSYCLGTFTNGFASLTLMAAAVVGIALFGRRPTVGYLALLVLGHVGIVAAAQLGLLQHAPALAGSPFQEGRLDGSWVIGVGGSLFIMLVAALAFIGILLLRWRERDARLERISDQLTRANETISRYVASQIASKILAGDTEFLERHERRRITLFFSDVPGLVSLADVVEPEDLSDLLNEYLSEMSGIAETHGGTIDKFVSDTMMIFFGAPDATDDRDQAQRAVRMALAMQERMRELHTKWAALGFDRPLEVRMGINTGRVSIGSFGSHGRMDYTAIGRHVNLAARIQTACEPGGILLGQSTWALVRDAFDCTSRGEIHVKGFEKPAQVYEVQGEHRGDVAEP